MAMPPDRRLLGLTLVVGVTAAHLWLAGTLSQSMHLGSRAEREAVRRMDVSFVRELEQAPAPPPPAAVTRPAPAPRPVAVAPAPTPAASQPRESPAAAERPATPVQAQASAAESAESARAVAAVAAAAAAVSEPARTEPVAAPTPAPAAPAPATTVAALPPAVGASAAGSGSPPFEWPPSTRLSYTLLGNFRGPVEGTARVEWLRQGSRYQVHLEVLIGPSFAPLVRRRMSSEGEITPQGLDPRRYEEETRVPLSAPRRKLVTFDPVRVVLNGGREVPTLPGVQDTASQFVQLTWLFTTQTERLQAGQTIVMPLALPHRVDRWLYDVVGQETVESPVGRIPTFHVKPRRENRQGDELTIEGWFAPTLQYLPVRIMIRQDDQTWADLTLQRLPQQAER